MGVTRAVSYACAPLGDVEECQRLGAVDRAMGREGCVGGSAGDLVCGSPGNRLIIILAARYVIKVVAVCILRRAADSSPQNGHCMSTGAKHIRRKRCSRGAGYDVLLQRPHNCFVIRS